jgi:hypothetical protein
VTAPSAGNVAGRLTMVGVFREPDYRRLWASGLCVNAARSMDLVALGWLALELTGSPFMVGLAAFARAAPLMVVGPFTGIVADRVCIGTQPLGTLAIGLLAASFGAPLAFTVKAAVALVVIVPLAVPLARGRYG